MKDERDVSESARRAASVGWIAAKATEAEAAPTSISTVDSNRNLKTIS